MANLTLNIDKLCELLQAEAGTYEQHNTKANNAELITGRKYVMTDQQQITKIQYTDTAGDGTSGDEEVFTGMVEPIVLTAISATEFDQRVVSVINPTDTIHYSIKNRLTDQPSNAKGYIYYRKDGLTVSENNHDFKNVINRRWNDGTGNYVIWRKVDAPDADDFKDYTWLTSNDSANCVCRRGTPDQAPYTRTNIVYQSGIVVIEATLDSASTTVNYNLKGWGVNYLTQRIANGMPVLDLLGNIANIAFGTTVVSFTDSTIELSQAPLTSGTFDIGVAVNDFGFNSANKHTSGSNCTITRLGYDNQVHIILNNIIKGGFELNYGTLMSNSQTLDFKRNKFNKLSINCQIFEDSEVINLQNVVINDEVRNTKFPSYFGSNDIITPTADMQLVTESTEVVLVNINELRVLEDYDDGVRVYRVVGSQIN